jgi:hypothetical protein
MAGERGGGQGWTPEQNPHDEKRGDAHDGLRWTVRKKIRRKRKSSIDIRKHTP